MTKTKLTKEAQELIIKNKDLSNRQLQLILATRLGIKTSHVAIGTFKKKHLSITFPSVKEVAEFTRKITKGPDLPKISRKVPKPKKTNMSFSEFMAKLDTSDCFAAHQLREKLAVKGKSRKINVDRILRIIQYTIDVMQEK